MNTETCTPLHDEPAAVLVEALEGLVARINSISDDCMRGATRYGMTPAGVQNIAERAENIADELTQLIKERSNG